MGPFIMKSQYLLLLFNKQYSNHITPKRMKTKKKKGTKTQFRDVDVVSVEF